MSNVQALFPAAVAAPSQFEELWALWPNKAKKVLAKAKYEAVIRGGFKTRTLDRDSGQYVDIELSADEAAVIAGAKAYVASQIDKRTYRFKDDGKYIPHLATWLNQGRWEDGL